MTIDYITQDAADAGSPPAVETKLGAIFLSMELSRSTWLITSLLPGEGERMSKHTLRAGDIAGLMERLSVLRQKASTRTGQVFPFVVIQEAGLDGFWIHRVLEQEGIESHVVDAASIAASRRRRRAKTDRLDGELLLRSLLSFKRGDPRVCAMVRPPTPEEEDRRRNSRERKMLVAERVKLVCCSRKGSAASNHSSGIAVRALTNWLQVTGAPCHPMPRRKLVGRLIVLSCCLSR
jgi:transposase